MDHVSVESFRAALGNYLDRVYFRKESFVVTRNGIPFVLLTPVPDDSLPSNHVNAREIRKNTSQMLGRVHFEETKLLVTRRGTPTAILTNLSPGGNNDLSESLREKDRG